MIVYKRTRTNKKPFLNAQMGYKHWEGWWLFGIIPLYIREI